MKRITPAQADQKYQPVLDAMIKQGLTMQDACDKAKISVGAFISWKRRREGKTGRVDKRTKAWKQKETPTVKSFTKTKTTESKKTNMVVMIGESADIFKALSMINYQD